MSSWRQTWRRIAGDDPPIRERILWKEGISAGTQGLGAGTQGPSGGTQGTVISGDRGLIARTYGTLFAMGGLVGLLILAVGERTDRHDGVIATLAVVAILLGAVCFIGYRRLPIGFFQVLTALGSLIIFAATASASHGAEPIYALFYVWIVFLAFFFLPIRTAVLQCLFAASLYGIVLFARDVPFAPNYMIAAAATLGTTGAMMGLMRARVEKIASRLADDAHTDTLTALANRRSFDARSAHEVSRAFRAGRPLSLIICDLDRFKAINDDLGHSEGDAALQRVAAVIAGSVRSIDAVSRLGGEEFAVLLPDATPIEAWAVSERVRKGISKEFANHAVQLTASCGIASLQLGADRPDRLLEDADVALYRAKRAGRNCSVAYSDQSADGADQVDHSGDLFHSESDFAQSRAESATK